MMKNVLSDALRRLMLRFGWVPLADLKSAHGELLVSRNRVHQVADWLTAEEARHALTALRLLQVRADADILYTPREDGGMLVQRIERA